MSDNEKEEREEVKTVKLTKKGKPEQRSIKSALNVSKARSKVKHFSRQENRSCILRTMRMIVVVMRS